MINPIMTLSMHSQTSTKPNLPDNTGFILASQLNPTSIKIKKLFFESQYILSKSKYPSEAPSLILILISIPLKVPIPVPILIHILI